MVYGLRLVTTKLIGSFQTELILLGAIVTGVSVVCEGTVDFPKVVEGVVVLHKNDSLLSYEDKIRTKIRTMKS